MPPLLSLNVKLVLPVAVATMLPELAQAEVLVGVVLMAIVLPEQGSTGPAGGAGEGSPLLQDTKFAHTKKSAMSTIKFTVFLFIYDFLKESYQQLNGLPVSKKKLDDFKQKRAALRRPF